MLVNTRLSRHISKEAPSLTWEQEAGDCDDPKADDQALHRAQGSATRRASPIPTVVLTVGL
jgi:hypothetical protein